MRSGKSVRLGALVFLTAASTFAPTCSFAHASLVSASPQNGARIVGDTPTIELRFNSRVDAKLSRLMLVEPNERKVTLPLDDVPSQDMLRAKAPDLEPGAYILRWQTLSVDGHLTQGEIKFSVGR